MNKSLKEHAACWNGSRLKLQKEPKQRRLTLSGVQYIIRLSVEGLMGAHQGKRKERLFEAKEIASAQAWCVGRRAVNLVFLQRKGQSGELWGLALETWDESCHEVLKVLG